MRVLSTKYFQEKFQIVKKNSLLFSLLFAGVLIAMLLPKFSHSWALSLCSLFIIAYAFISYQNAKGVPDLLAIAGDQVYLLGYLYTISALLGIGLSFESIGNDTTIIPIAILKLSTTVLGLSIMMVMKILASNADVEGGSYLGITNEMKDSVPPPSREYLNDLAFSRKSILDNVKQMSKDLEALQTNVNSFNESIRSSGKEMGILQKTTEDINNNFIEMGDQVTKISPIMRNSVDEMQQFSRELSGAQSKIVTMLDEMGDQLGAPKESLERFTTQINSAESGLSNMNSIFQSACEAIDQLRNQIEAFSSSSGNANTEMDGFVRNVQETKSILDDFIEVIKQKTETYA